MIYVIDHEDSFTYNLAHLLDNIQPTIVSNYYEIDYKKLEKSNIIVLSPGPGEPKDYPLTTRIYNKYNLIKRINMHLIKTDYLKGVNYSLILLSKKNDELNDFFVGINIRNPDDFYEKLYNLDENKKIEMTKRAKEYYKKKCSYKEFKDNYLEVINQFKAIKNW